MEGNNINEGVIGDIASAVGKIGASLIDFLKSVFGKLFSDANNSKFDNSLKSNPDWKLSSDMVSFFDVNSKDLEIATTARSTKKIWQVIGFMGSFAANQKNKELEDLWKQSSKLFNTVAAYNMLNVNDILQNQLQEQPNNQLKEEPKQENINDMLSSLSEETPMNYEELIKNEEVKSKLDELGLTNQESLDNFKKLLISNKAELKL